MNKKAQTSLGISIIVAISIFIIGIPIINLIIPDVDIAVGTSGLDCDNSTGISDGTKLTCLAVDLTIPYFILLVISVSGGYIVNKFL